MKNIFKILISVLLAAAMLSACGKTEPPAEGGIGEGTSSGATEETAADPSEDESGNEEENAFSGSTEIPDEDEKNGSTEEIPDEGKDPGFSGEIAFGPLGKIRIAYTGDISRVQYITSVGELPSGEDFSEFDEEFFGKKALLLVTETASSGSTEISIESIEAENGNAKVRLKKETGEAGTCDMATWMIFAEVEKGLGGFIWEIEDPFVKAATY